MPERMGPYGTILKEPPVSKWKPGPGKWGIPKMGRDYEDLWERYEARMREQVWGGIQPQPRYRPAFYEMAGGLPGSRYYKDWFESMFPSLVHRFEATLPTYKGYRAAEYAAEEAEKIQETWADWLKGKQKGLRERFWSLRPERRGEKPWAYQQMIRTRSF